MIRTLIAAGLVALAAAGGAEAAGLHKKDWFTVTFKDVAEDMAMAREEGKRLAIIVEQENCLYCKKMHEEVLSDPEVADYIREHFMVVQYDMWGAEEITDLDGEVMTEKAAVRRWALNFTPTVLFLAEEPGDAGTAKDAAVQVMPGAFGKWTVLHMFQWVAEKRYEGEQPFQKWHAEEIEKLRAAGRL